MKVWVLIHSGQWCTSKNLAASGEAVWKRYLCQQKETHRKSPLLLILSQLDVVTGTAAAILQPWRQARMLSSINLGPYFSHNWVLEPDSLLYVIHFLFCLSQLNWGFSFLQPKPDVLLKTLINSPITIKILGLKVIKPGKQCQHYKESWTLYLLLEIL